MASTTTAGQLDSFMQPARDLSVLPFWFWNDDLTEAELLRQIDDFEAHGVYGFVIHPRVGLPRDTGWMSPRLLECMRFATEEAARRDMTVVLYDEGMYPSGSSSGQVVAENPLFACRGLARIELEGDAAPELPPGHNLVAVVERQNGQRIAVVDRPVDSVIRGLHYLDEANGDEETTPPAADLLNPDAVLCFRRLVYDRYYQELGPHFGKTIIGVFTDEPGLLGRSRETEKVWPGTTGILPVASDLLGYDFAPHLPALWYDDEPDASEHREAYLRAVKRRLEETYYRPLSDWCEAHGVALMGHPAQPDELGMERYFHIPGQDIVWRYIEPDKPSALEGPQSTQAKCTSSAMLHLGRRRNSNECYGAYGHELTYEEMRWIADWLFVRGVNMLLPHAFYYSVRGPRLDERPPDVGPNSAWWPDYSSFALYCRRLSWLNTDSEHICRVAILGESNFLPWQAAKICFEHQLDFNYLEARDLWENATVDDAGLHLAGMSYRALVVDGLEALPARALAPLQRLNDSGRVLVWQTPVDGMTTAKTLSTEAELVAAVDALSEPPLRFSPHQPGLRVRGVRKRGIQYWLLFNEGARELSFDVDGPGAPQRLQLDAWTGIQQNREGSRITLQPRQTMILL
jgi:hypothetical protein